MNSNDDRFSRNLNAWKTMSAADKAPFLAKVKEPYQGKIAEFKQIRGEEDWNEDLEFDTIAFFGFCDAKSENESLNGPFDDRFSRNLNAWKTMSAAVKAPFPAKVKEPYQGKIAEFRKTRGEDWNEDLEFDTIAFNKQLETERLAYEARKLVYEGIDMWAETPKARAKARPKPRAKARRAKAKAKAKEKKEQAEAQTDNFVESEDKCYQEAYAMTEFGQDRFNIPKSDNALPHFMREEVAKAWEETSDEDKAPYLKLAKHLVDQMRKMERGVSMK